MTAPAKKLEGKGEVTQLLERSQAGDSEALNKLLPLVYAELKRVAKSYMGREKANHTLQPTALIHETFLRITGVRMEYQNRAHFMAMAAKTMRRVLVDHAKAKKADKRGGKDRVHLTLEEGELQGSVKGADVLELEEALLILEKEDPRLAQVIELHYFGGMSADEIAGMLKISAITVKRDWAKAKLWLYHQIKSQK